MKKQFVRLTGGFTGLGLALFGLSSCALPRMGGEDAEQSLSATNMEGLAPETMESALARSVESSGGESELPEELLVAGPAYEGERKSPWDIPADEFVTLVSRSEMTAGDESLLEGGDLLAYASSVLAERKIYSDTGTAEGVEEPSEAGIQPETDRVLGAVTREPAMDSIPGVASDVVAIADTNEEEPVEALAPIEKPRPAPEPTGAITSAGNFTVSGVVDLRENAATAGLPRHPVSLHQRFRTVRATASFEGEDDGSGSAVRTALGTELQTGMVRSAAADWSFYPVGTRFRLVGDVSGQEYVVDDFAEGLAGGLNLELHMPNALAGKEWGSRDVVIEVLNWGSFEKSLAIMKSSEARMASPQVRQMVSTIEGHLGEKSKAERGFRPEGGLLGRIASRKAQQ